MTASLAGYLDQPGSPQYNASKWGVRGLMRSLRRTCPQFGIRVNILAPWFIHTGIMSDAVAELLKSKGVAFAGIEDAGAAALHIASDLNVNGQNHSFKTCAFAALLTMGSRSGFKRATTRHCSRWFP